jgi:hypothetical protein
MSKPSYDKLIYAATLLAEARQERLKYAEEDRAAGQEAHAKEWEEGASRLNEVIQWLDGGAL